MSKLLLLSIVLVLSGCAEMIERAQRDREIEMRRSISAEESSNLCAVILARPAYRALAESELIMRGYECDWPQAQARASIYLQQEQANNAAAMSAAMGYVNTMNAQTNALNAAAAAQAQRNQPINCYSQPQGYGVSTTCR
jgi:hypothetical protein